MLPSWRRRRDARSGGNGTGRPDRPGTGFGDAGGQAAATARRTGWKKWVLGTLKWGSIAASRPLRHRGRRRFRRLQQDLDPAAQRPRRQAGLDRLLRRRQDRARPHRRARTATASRWPSPRCPSPSRTRTSPPRTARSTRTTASRSAASCAREDEHHRRDPGGGSTITQQYVKNYFLTQDRTLTRKAREILIAVKIDGQRASRRSSRSTSTRSTTAAAPTASRAAPRPTSARTSAS